ncbi:hypothetical protein L202_01152 [Cryptococcus amylolentus CBS 6039]|uniref:Thioesterase domain-containing protein n=2 Tax=Cryptococcus amylolentus TaxID=104669 RepID=A0A1E3I3F1_9TREE|nr:hypothetical protein L202_01152 [Cryptococcus amylolentus CBS 6039]ODN82895.1 hypothetical protein L202_01152 [Cryptococcus amylolentus CBS 6039]ODO10545.1 hypothetical protein I350_01142 [Cryptococcus amylolentus CBS 6273]
MACLKFLQNVWQKTLTKGGHDFNVLSSLRVVEARPGYLKGILRIEPKHLNNHNTIHGGAILTLTDTITSLSLSTHGLSAPTGVSVDLNTSFVRPGGTVGDDLICIGIVEQLGRTLAYTRCEFRTPPGGEKGDRLVAYGAQTKFMGGAKAVTKFSKDGETELGLEEQAKL